MTTESWISLSFLTLLLLWAWAFLCMHGDWRRGMPYLLILTFMIVPTFSYLVGIEPGSPPGARGAQPQDCKCACPSHRTKEST